MTWELLENTCAACQKCALGATRTKSVFGTGSRTADLLFVGEAPGEQEDLQGEPFVGPAGKLLDDMLSMFPFKNQLAYVEHTGKQIRAILEEMAARRFQVLGGVRVVADDGKLVSVEIDGEPLDDEKIYGMATISFLLTGGDGLKLEENAVSVTRYDDVQIIDAVLELC